MPSQYIATLHYMSYITLEARSSALKPFQRLRGSGALWVLLLQTTIRGQGFLCLALAIGHAVNAKLTLLITEPARKAMSGFGAWLFAAPLLNEVSCPVKLWGLGLTASSTSGFKVLFKSWGWPPVLHQELAATAAQPYRRTWPAVFGDSMESSFPTDEDCFSGSLCGEFDGPYFPAGASGRLPPSGGGFPHSLQHSVCHCA